MRKLLFVLLAFIAVFTYIRVFDNVEAGELPLKNNAENLQELTVENVR